MRIRLLGRFSVTTPGEDRTPSGLAAEVVKICACSPRPLHWEEIAEALWPGLEPERGRMRLRNVLSRLRARSGDVLVRRGATVAVSGEASIDIVEFEALAHRALRLAAEGDKDAARFARHALEQYRGELLPEDRYAEWTLQPRDRLKRRARALLELLVADARARGDLEGALLLLDRVRELEPDAQEVAQQIVEILSELGRLSSALRLSSCGSD